MKTRTLVSLLLVCLVASKAVAQPESELDRLDHKLKQHVEGSTPGWQHKRGELIQGSKDVLVQWWSFPNRVVKVSIIPRLSIEDAQEKMELFVKNEAEITEIKGLGDEAYAWGDGQSNIIFRKNKYSVYVSTTANVGGDQDATILSPAEKGERRKSEMKRLSKQFAKYVVAAIDASSKH